MHGPQSSGPEYEEILIKVVYSLRNPVDGVQFMVPTDSYPYVRSSTYLKVFASRPNVLITANSARIYHSFFTGRCAMLDSLCGQHLREMRLGV